MTRAMAGLTCSMLAASLLAPGLALGDGDRDRRDGDGDRRHHQRPSVTVRPGPPPAQPPSLQTRVHVPGHRGHVPRPHVWPPIYYEPGYAPAPLYAPPLESTTSMAPPTPSVVEYPNGRYELRGDGVWSAYRWVWIPNPPSAPPAEAFPPAPPAEAPPEPAATAAPRATDSAPRTELYRWTDDQGIVHWTDRWDAIPEPYRGKATKLKS